MGEFLAEASVLIAPDTTKFRATLIAQLRKATEGLVVPIPVAAAAGAKSAVAANKAAAASAQQATVATNQLTASRTKGIIASRAQASADENLIQAQRLTAAAQQRVQAVETAGIRSTSELAAARAELRAANVAVVAGQRAVDAAFLEGASAAQAEAVAVLRTAVALRAEAIAAEAAAAATVVGGRATAAATRAHEQFARGVGASTLSLGNVRGATLAASSGFLIGAAAVTIAAKSVQEAVKEQEAAARVTAVFGDAAEQLEKNARGMAAALGVSTAEALRFEGQIGNILRVSRLASDEIPRLSESLVTLGANMAIFANVPIEQTLSAISLGLVGNSRGLRKFGIELGASAVNMEALRISGKKNTDELTRGERVQARINLLFQQTANQTQAAANRQDSLAQKARVLKAELANLGASIGSKLIPELKRIVDDGQDVVGVLQAIDDKVTSLFDHIDKATGGGGGKGKGGFFSQAFAGIKDFAFSSLTQQADFFARTVKDLDKQINGSTTDLDKLHAAAVKAFQQHDPRIYDRELVKIAATQHDLDIGMKQLKIDNEKLWLDKSITQFLNNLDRVLFQVQHIVRVLEQARVTGLTNQIATLQDQLVGVKVAGGDAATQLAKLEQIRARQQSLVTADEALVGTTKGRSKAALDKLRADRQDLLNTIEEIKSIKQDQADAAAKAAQDILDAVEAAKQRAQEAIDAANQALQDLIDAIARPLDFEQLQAESTKSLVDDIRLQQDIQKNARARIALVSKMIIPEAERAAKIHELRLEIRRAQLEEKALVAEQAQRRQQRRQQAFDRKAESIDLDIQLAQTNKNVRGEIAARQRRIRLDQERMKAVRGDIIATKRLRNDIAAQRAAIKDLKKELDKRNNELQQLEFAFLQRQAGFAANLLSNLIPTSALVGTVGGTVGGGAISTGTGSSGILQRRGMGDFPVRSGVSSATQTHVAQRGASQSQMATLIHIQRGMLGLMARLVGQRTHPEASHQRTQQATSMDTV